MSHTPVLLKEVLDYLNPKPGDVIIDATINGGGHAEKILEKIMPSGILFGIDRDPSILKETRKRLALFGDRLILARGNFRKIAPLAKRNHALHPQSILFDLGTSSYHLASGGRGFSFMGDEPLDMRFNPEETPLTAEAILNHASPYELERIFSEYGEERRARRLAETIVKERKRRRFVSTRDLVALIERILPRGRIHPATKIFQALRIAVNDELNSIKDGLNGAYQILAPGGRIAVISFHSLEDRMVKNFFKEKRESGMILTKKPITASLEEIRTNPRSRSAKLRVFQKTI